LAQKVLKNIADEERVHAGEFFRLLKHLAPDEENFYDEGAEEVEQLMEKLKKQPSSSLSKGPKNGPDFDKERLSRLEYYSPALFLWM